MAQASLTDAELDELARPGSEIGFSLETGRDGRTWIRPDEASLKAHRAVPRLVAEVRRLRREAEELRAEGDRLRERPKAPATKPPPAGAEQERAQEELGSMLSAPFRVSARAAAAAKTDPLRALAVQVARGLAEGASELERARLIAMAFAAAEGDLEGLWEARRRRTTRKPTSKK